MDRLNGRRRRHIARRAYGRSPGAYRRDRFTAPTLGASIAAGQVADAARSPVPGS
jgi:hypothetical protein